MKSDCDIGLWGRMIMIGLNVLLMWKWEALMDGDSPSVNGPVRCQQNEGFTGQ